MAMAVRALLRFARIAPRKARLVANTIRGLPVDIARVRLGLVEQRSGAMLLKLLNSAVANATHNFQMKEQSLRVSLVRVNEGPRLRRYMPRARGSANRIIKRTSHIEIAVDAVVGVLGATPTKRKVAIETKKVEELSAEELREAGSRRKKSVTGEEKGSAVKPSAVPRGVKPLTERRHGSA